jgi:pimeloyl-ACP methyl ester carboxylesterase
MGPRGRAAFRDVERIARTVADALSSGHYRAGAACFVDYWNGPGSWDAMKPEVQADLVRSLPKACIDFRALFEEDTPRSVYGGLRFPVLVIAGEFAPAPTRVVAEALGRFIPGALSRSIPGAGHMGPCTHAEAVNDAILAHIRKAGTAPHRRVLPLEAA